MDSVDLNYDYQLLLSFTKKINYKTFSTLSTAQSVTLSRLCYHIVNHYEVNIIKKAYLLLWNQRDVSYITTNEVIKSLHLSNPDFYHSFFTYCNDCVRMCDFFQFIILFTVYDRKSLLGILLATAQIPEYFTLTVKEIHTFSNFLHIDQTSYGNIIKHFEREKNSVQIDSFLQYLCDEIPLGLLDVISLQLQENLLGVNTFNNIKNRQKNIEYIIKFKEQHNNENPSESLGVRIRHYFTGEPSSYQYDYIPTSTDTYTSILQYYRDQYNIPRPKELPPLYHHNNGDKASNKLLSDLSSHSHSHSDYNEDQISLIKRAYGNRTAEIPACFRSSSRSKYSVNASRSERSSEEENDNDNDNDGMSPLQIQRTSSHNSTIRTSLHPKSKYKNSVEKTCWINVNPVVVKPFGQVCINESDDEK